MKKAFIFILLLGLSVCSYALELDKNVFEVINLDHKGLEKVKQYHNEGKDKEALIELLKYYRTRTSVSHPDIDLQNVKIGKEEQKWADDGLKHIFFVHEGYQPAYHYGDDINWQYWPVKDNELRWQLHRMKWWQPMGKAYYVSKDEKYAKEWITQYMDWIEKNPLVEKNFKNEDPDTNVDLIDNVRFAWRPLEVSHRVQDQTIQFLLFLNSENFTPEFLSNFLTNYNKHANHIINHYSDRGNHLLFEAQRLLYAGSLFPELKDASTWRKSGIEVLLREMKAQVYDDGVQYELDLGYHLAAINIFSKALRIATDNGFGKEFPMWYTTTIRKMIKVVQDTNFPDGITPMFSDNKLGSKRVVQRNFGQFRKLFPKDKEIQYVSSDRERGEAPAYLSSAFPIGGFYIFRTGWTEDATQMVVKAGPPAFWHNQPDNGTFEMYINGRNFFLDSGSYVYGGDQKTEEARAWFKQTRVHNTLTLDNKNLEETNSKCLLWDIDKKEEILVTENPSYKGLTHRRSIFFVDKKFFVIVDEAIGDATGEVGIHYNLSVGDVKMDNAQLLATTNYEDKNNIQIQGFSDQKLKMEEEEGWVSYKIRHKVERPAFAFSAPKAANETSRYITVIYPIKDKEEKIGAKFTDKGYSKDGMKLQVTVGKKKYELKYNL